MTSSNRGMQREANCAGIFRRLGWPQRDDGTFVSPGEQQPDESDVVFARRKAEQRRKEEARHERDQRDQRGSHLSRSGVRITPPMRRAIVEGTLEEGGSPALSAVRDLVERDLSTDFRPMLILLGPPGGGKTVAAAWGLSRKDGVYLPAAQLVRAMRDHSDHYDMQRRLRNAPLVVIDEVGIGRNEAVGNALHELVDSRQSDVRTRTILISNGTRRDVWGALDPRTQDRLRQLATWTNVAIASLRPGDLPRGVS